MTEVERNAAEYDGQSKGEAVVSNSVIREIAHSIALEHFVCYAIREKDRKVLQEKIDQIAFAIKDGLKNSKIPCEKKPLFVDEGEVQ
jgi:predicted SprT family Zn-dependent metalloprotease